MPPLVSRLLMNCLKKCLTSLVRVDLLHMDHLLTAAQIRLADTLYGTSSQQFLTSMRDVE